MSKPIKVSDEQMQALREAAALHSRSIAGQADHWLRLGRAAERANPHVAVEQALKDLPLAPIAESAEALKNSRAAAGGRR